MSIKAGQGIEFIRAKDLEARKTNQDGHAVGGYAWVRKGDKGKVLGDREDGDSNLDVLYDLGNGIFARFTHSLSYLGKSFRFINQPTLTMSVQSERSYALYVASSSEDIKGYVPQVRYREEIVWQGDPVPTTDDSGEAVTKEEQAKAALKVAEDKIQEVVKKQFA